MKGWFWPSRSRVEVPRCVERFVNTSRVSSYYDWSTLGCSTEVVVVAAGCCNEPRWIVLDVSDLTCLRSIEIGSDCFKNVEEVKWNGLNVLESVVIGKNSFTRHKNSCGKDPNRHFQLKNCERVRELKIGCYSFNDYSVCEIENLPSLEVIEMGELNKVSINFHYASLELRSDGDGMK